MTYPDAIQFLYELRWFGTKLGLSNTLRLAALAGNPHHALRFIHVAGTNGKGSTCAMLESIYRAAGLRVGLFTSPHLVNFSERIQVNRQPVTQEQVVRLVAGLQRLLRQFDPAEHPTFFEVVTVMALQHFAAQQCQLVIWETGMGGRLDATNIVTPLASVITNIGQDHEEWLGNTLSAIATEKAGIIKPSVPVITGVATPEALKVIAETAARQNAPLTVVTPADTRQAPLDTLELALRGEHQRLNAAVALATVNALQPLIPVSAQAICHGLTSVCWPGRLQILSRGSTQKIVLDGAHNLAGTQSLAVAFKELFPGVRPTLVLGVLGDKDWQGMCRVLAPMAGRILLAPVATERTASPERLQQACREANPAVETAVCANVREALDRAAHDPLVLVTGSLYLVGEALDLLQSHSQPQLDERTLNEWAAKV